MKLCSMDAETGFEPVSSGYEPDKAATPLLCNKNSHFKFSKDLRLVSTSDSKGSLPLANCCKVWQVLYLIFDFHNSSTARFDYSGNFWYLTATVVSPYIGRPGTSGELNEIREANSLSLNLEALVIKTSLALHLRYPPTGRGPTSFW